MSRAVLPRPGHEGRAVRLEDAAAPAEDVKSQSLTPSHAQWINTPQGSSPTGMSLIFWLLSVSMTDTAWLRPLAT